MAKIVFGAGCSHSPLLATKPEQWDLRANDDRKNPEHPYRGKVYSFTVRAGKAPRVQITCLQPDKLRAGAGC